MDYSLNSGINRFQLNKSIVNFNNKAKSEDTQTDSQTPDTQENTASQNNSSTLLDDLDRLAFIAGIDAFKTLPSKEPIVVDATLPSVDKPTEPPVEEPIEPPVADPIEPPIDTIIDKVLPPVEEPINPPADEPLPPAKEPTVPSVDNRFDEILPPSEEPSVPPVDNTFDEVSSPVEEPTVPPVDNAPSITNTSIEDITALWIATGIETTDPKGIKRHVGLDVQSFYESLQNLSESDNEVLRQISELFTSAISELGLNENEALAFVYRVFKGITSADKKISAINSSSSYLDMKISKQNLLNINKNDNGSFLDELSEIINNVASKIKEPQGDATTLDLEMITQVGKKILTKS